MHKYIARTILKTVIGLKNPPLHHKGELRGAQNIT